MAETRLGPRRRSGLRIRDPGLEDVAVDHLGGDASKTNWTPRSPRRPRSQSQSSVRDRKERASSRPGRRGKKSQKVQSQDSETDWKIEEQELSGGDSSNSSWLPLAVVIAIGLVAATLAQIYMITGADVPRILNIIRYTADDLPVMRSITPYDGHSLVDLSEDLTIYQKRTGDTVFSLSDPIVDTTQKDDWARLDEKVLATHHQTVKVHDELEAVIKRDRENFRAFFTNLDDLWEAFEEARDHEATNPNCKNSRCLRNFPSDRAKFLSDAFFEFIEGESYYSNLMSNITGKAGLSIRISELQNHVTSCKEYLESLINNIQEVKKPDDPAALLSGAYNRQNLDLKKRRDWLTKLDNNLQGLERLLKAINNILFMHLPIQTRHLTYLLELKGPSKKDMQLGFEGLEIEKELDLFNEVWLNLEKFDKENWKTQKSWNIWEWIRDKKPIDKF